MSDLRVTNLRGRTAGSSPTLPDGVVITGVATATSFSGNLTGNVTGNATGLSGTPNITVGNIIGVAATFSGVVTYEDVTNVDSIGIVTARSGVRITDGGLVVTAGVSTFSGGVSALNVTGVSTLGILSATDTRLKSVGEKSSILTGTTLSLVYNTGGGNIAIHTNPSADVTLAITGIPTDTSFDNTTISFSAVLINTGTARSCTAVTLNGYSTSIKWFGGSLANATSGVTTSTGTDIYSFTGINTVGSASTTTNYLLLGNVNGSYR